MIRTLIACTLLLGFSTGCWHEYHHHHDDEWAWHHHYDHYHYHDGW